MKVEIELVSKEIIKPSSPTPNHISYYQLSFLDQISPPVYNPLLFFYSPEDIDSHFTIIEISNKLKTSLSEILSLFYPLAGRLDHNQFINCNDEGIPYLETRVNCKVSDIIQNPNPNELSKFIPFELDQVSEFLFGVQLNIFECGGVAIGSCVSHKVADALSSFTFIKSWAAIARGETEQVIIPKFESASLFPPKDLSGFNPATGITKKNVISKRFVFLASMVEYLKAQYAESKSLKDQRLPSRVEALSAFIWSRFVASSSDQFGSRADKGQKVYALLHAVNLRTRIEPPLSENSFGNLYRVAITVPRLETGEEQNNYSIVRQVRDQISLIDKEYVKKLQEGCDYLDFMKKSSKEFFKGEFVTLNFTSLCRFPLYESDFGWGKPTWVGSPALTFKNLIIFKDTKSGDGIEMYLNLEVEDMAKLEADKEFRAFVSQIDR